MHKTAFLSAMSILFVLFISASSFAATIKGNVYDLELDNIQDAVVQINSTPIQTFVSKEGAYVFEVPEGKYLIYAKQDEKDLFAKEKITIVKDGVFVVDLILFPNLEEEEFLFNETEEEIEEEETPIFSYVILISLFLLIILFFIRMESKNKTEAVQNKPATDHQQPTTNKLDELAQQILDFIKKEQGRVTQKEIREQFPLSEAKISLIITELEEKGFVKKIKRGRGNIITANQS